MPSLLPVCPREWTPDTENEKGEPRKSARIFARAQHKFSVSRPRPAPELSGATGAGLFAAGGPTDIITRIVGEHFSRILGQQFVVENVAGAGGTTGITRGAQAKADGYTIMMGHMGTHGAAPALYPNLKYDPTKDFEPIGMAAGTRDSVAASEGAAAEEARDVDRVICSARGWTRSST
jgi:hypothetical protein